MRLIDADILKKEFPKDTDWEYPVNTNEYVCEKIDEQPTIEERKHGKWIVIWDRDDSNTSTYAECSECRKKQLRPVGCFCKWCGADMRGEQDE